MKKLMIGLFCGLLFLSGCDKNISMDDALVLTKKQLNGDYSLITKSETDDDYIFEFENDDEIKKIVIEKDGELSDVSTSKKESSTASTNTNDSLSKLGDFLTYLNIDANTVTNVTESNDDGMLDISFTYDGNAYSFDLLNGEVNEYDCNILNYESGSISQDEALNVVNTFTNKAYGCDLVVREVEFSAEDHEYEFEGTINNRLVSFDVYDNGIISSFDFED